MYFYFCLTFNGIVLPCARAILDNKIRFVSVFVILTGNKSGIWKFKFVFSCHDMCQFVNAI